MGPHEIAKILGMIEKRPTLASVSPVQLILQRSNFCEALSMGKCNHLDKAERKALRDE